MLSLLLHVCLFAHGVCCVCVCVCVCACVCDTQMSSFCRRCTSGVPQAVVKCVRVFVCLEHTKIEYSCTRNSSGSDINGGSGLVVIPVIFGSGLKIPYFVYISIFSGFFCFFSKKFCRIREKNGIF